MRHFVVEILWVCLAIVVLWAVDVLVGCAPYEPLCPSGPPPGEALTSWSPTAVQRCERADCPSLEATARAIAIVDDEAHRVLGRHAQVLRHVRVTWRPQRSDGITGLQDSVDPWGVVVHPRAGVVAGSALAHELIHLVALEVLRDVDGGHRITGLWRRRRGDGSVEDAAQARIGEAGL